MTDQQRAALKIANRIRKGQTAIKRELRALPPKQSLPRVADLIESPLPCLASMRAFDLVIACRKVGEARAGKWFLNANANPFHRIGDGRVRHGDLHPAERARIVARLRRAAEETDQYAGEYARRRARDASRVAA
jgi:hypothetical protein